MAQKFFAFFLLFISLFSSVQAQPDSLDVATDMVQAIRTNAFASDEVKLSELDASTIFQLVNAEGKPESAKVNWVLDYTSLSVLKDKKVVIKYLTSIGAKRADKGMKAEWNYSDPIPATDIEYLVEDLQGNEKYELYVGLITKGETPIFEGENSNIIWSEKIKVRTDRGWDFLKFLILVGSLGLFIFGMKVMSDGLQRASGPKLRQMLGSITSNRVKGVVTGFMSTAIVQSSSVTTVMTVSLVNAGLLTLRQSAGVMMGANIGTTITAWLVLLLGFKVDISNYALMMIAIGAPFLFMAFDKSKEIANSIIGFAILFIGLQYLKNTVPDLDKDSDIVQFFINYKDIPVLSNLMFVGLGALVTIVVQSSSAAMALTLTMVSKGIIPYEVACAMILGENIGTTITAELASIIGNVHAKRSARIHSLFNVVGVTWMLLIFPIFTKMVGWIVAGDAFDATNPDMADTGLAMFHTTFNLANVVVMIWFVPQLVNLAEKTVKSKGDSDEEFKLDYIGGSSLSASVGLFEAKKEVAKFGRITSRMSQFTRIILNDPNKKTKVKMTEKIAKYEEITDRVEVEIAQFLEKLASGEMSSNNSIEVRSMLSITNDLERIGDIFFQMSKTFESKTEKRVYFDPKQRESLNEMLDLIDRSFEIMNENLNSEYGKIDVKQANDVEEELQTLRDDLKKAYLKKVQKGDENIRGSIIYNEVFSHIAKIGDHIVNISQAVGGKV